MIVGVLGGIAEEESQSIIELDKLFGVSSFIFESQKLPPELQAFLFLQEIEETAMSQNRLKYTISAKKELSIRIVNAISSHKQGGVLVVTNDYLQSEKDDFVGIEYGFNILKNKVWVLKNDSAQSFAQKIMGK